ncbi:MAG: hypothetical protein ABI425_05260 [Patescibacteria group bacterium]
MYLFIICFSLLVPLLALSIYQHNGKRQIFQLDFVQFMYLFVFMPVLFIWAKAFLFYLLNTEVSNSLSSRDIFTIDTTFSIVALYLFSATAIHTLTKTFWLRKQDDPDFDIFHLSEYFHLWWSHIFMDVGGMIAFCFLSTINAFIAFNLVESQFKLLFTMALGIVLGIFVFFMIWSQDPKQERKRFLRLMKVCLIIVSVYHVFLYLLIEPQFSMNYFLFWFIFSVVVSATISSFSFVYSKKARRLHERMLHQGWGDNIQIFKPRESLKK